MFESGYPHLQITIKVVTPTSHLSSNHIVEPTSRKRSFINRLYI